MTDTYDFYDLAEQAVAAAADHIECEVDMLRSRLQGQAFADAIRFDLPAGLPDLRWLGHRSCDGTMRFSAQVRRSMSIYHNADLEGTAEDFAAWCCQFARGLWTSEDSGDCYRSTLFTADMHLGTMAVTLRLYVPVDFIAPDHARRVVGERVAIKTREAMVNR
jgi:hypothetical protein